MNQKEKENSLFEGYTGYFKKHNNAVYICLGILFLSQIIILISTTTQINSLEKNNAILAENVNNLTANINQSFDKVDAVLSEHTLIQGEIIKDLDLLKLSKDFTNVAEKASKSVVSINSFNTDYTGGVLGTGFFVNTEGYVATNYHVIKYLRYIDVVTNSKQTYRAKIIGYNEFKDIALLKIEINSSYLEFADSNNLQVGQKVIAIGNPLGLEFSVSEGVISGLKRQGDNNLQSYIQTDVSINPGNSGGPLLNSEGKVVGMNTFKYVDQAVEGMGFALESNELKTTLNQIAGFELVK